MRRVGTLERIGQNKGLVVIEAEELPPIGGEAVDEHLEVVGTVVDVIGPTERPWVVLNPAGSTSLVSHLGKRLYLRES